jgi:PAS domain S-box-containing protein
MAASGMNNDDFPDVDDLLRLLAEQTIEHAIVFIDTEGCIRWWSRGAEHIFDIPGSEAIGQHSSRMFTPEQVAEGVPQHEMAVARTNVAAEDDRWLARADGSRFWATGVLNPLHDKDGRLVGFGKILRNRTDIKEQLDVLRNKARASAAASRRKDVFLSSLSHELRNPLGALSNAAKMIRLTAPELPELEHPLRIIERQVASLRRLVDDLMDVSRIGAGKMEIRKEAVDLNQVVERAVESVIPLIQERRHRLELLMPQEPMNVEADADRLVQVFSNLIDNAAKYTLESGKIWIKGTTEGEEAVVRVEDSGIGIQTDLLPQIFKLFTQVESSRAHSQGGLGLGLNLVQNLVTLHGGSVQVRSDGEGKGSEFTVRLPLQSR